MRKLFTKLSGIVLVFFLVIESSFAQQNIRVKGTVSDAANGESLIGVSIKIKGTTQGTSTDASGAFTISAPANGTLVFSYIGYQNTEVPINNQATLNVKMKTSAAALKEVVVIGYGTANRRDLTGSIASVNGREVADKPSPNPVSSIQGKVAGVQIVNSGRPGGSPDVRIRGTNTINGTSPLYVVDGILNDNINFLNPADIESMEVLKDPSSLAIFGVRGANGVIIVTTKKGKTDRVSVNFNSTVGFKDVVNRMKLADASQFKMLYDEQLANQGSNPYDYTNWTGNTDWQDQIFQKGILNYNNLNVSGGSEKNTFYMGMGYNTEDGLIKHENYNKITLNLNDQLNVTKALRFGVNFSGYRAKLPQDKNVDAAIKASPIAEPYNQQWGLYSILPDFQSAQVWNPLIDVEVRKNTAINYEYRAVGSVFGELDFLKHFNFRTALFADYGFNNNRSYSPLVDVYDAAVVNDDPISHLVRSTSVTQTHNTYTKIQADYLLTYKNNFGDHNLTFLAGLTSYYNSFEDVTASRSMPEGQQQIPNDPRLWYVRIGDQSTQTGTGSAWDRATLSYLLRALYNYKGKYLLNTSFRRDGSSAFQGSGRWQNFGAVGAGWVVSEENFMKNQNVVNYLKLKGSWGILGNQNTGDAYRYPSYPTVTTSNSAVFGDNIVPAYEPEYLADENLHWEEVHSWEAGFEMNSLRDKLHFEGLYYHKTTRDMLALVPGISGTRPGLENAGQLTNKGIELMTSYKDNITSGLTYSVSANLTTINNKVNSLVNQGFNIISGQSRTSAGYPIGYFYGYVSDGVYQTNQEIRVSPVNTLNEVKPGDIKYKDINGDGVIDVNDRTIIGNPTPDFTYGASVSLGYKGFDLSADFMGVYGNEILREWNRQPYTQFNYQEDALNRWHGVGTSNWVPILDPGRSNNSLPSTYFIEDGSFFRIRNIQLGYNFNTSLLSKMKVQSLRVFLNAQNPATFKKNTGYTPEIGGSSIAFGVDNGTYPVPAIYTFGVNLNF